MRRVPHLGSVLTQVVGLAVAGIVAGTPSLCAQTAPSTFLHYRWVDPTTRATSSAFTDPHTGLPIGLTDSIVLDLRGIKQVEVRSDAQANTVTVVATLTPAARSAFTAATTAHVGHRIAVVLDDHVVTVARIESPLTSPVPIVIDIRRAVAESLVTRINRAIVALPKDP